MFRKQYYDQKGDCQKSGSVRTSGLVGFTALSLGNDITKFKYVRNLCDDNDYDGDYQEIPFKSSRLNPSVPPLVCQPVRQNYMWGVPNYLPNRCAGEDDKSIKRLVAVIQNEIKKISSNR